MYMKSIILFLFFILVLFYLTQYVQNIVPSAYSYYNKLMRYFLFIFFIPSLQNSWYFTIKAHFNLDLGFPGGTSGKESPANAGDARDVGLIPGSGRSPGGGNGNPLQYSGLATFQILSIQR